MIGDFSLRLFTSLFAAGDPNPIPSGASPTIVPTIDPDRVTPGIWGFLSLLVLIAAAVILYFSLRKQLRRVDFDEDKVNAQLRAEEEAHKAAHHQHSSNTPKS